MNNQHGPFHRSGQPGGAGCQVTAIPINGRSSEGSEINGSLFDAGPEATELELLRTVAHTLKVAWGHDEFGWWAAVPVKLPDQESEPKEHPRQSQRGFFARLFSRKP